MRKHMSLQIPAADTKISNIIYSSNLKYYASHGIAHFFLSKCKATKCPWPSKAGYFCFPKSWVCTMVHYEILKNILGPDSMKNSDIIWFCAVCLGKGLFSNYELKCARDKVVSVFSVFNLLKINSKSSNVKALLRVIFYFERRLSETFIMSLKYAELLIP